MEDTRPNGLGAEEDHPSETTTTPTADTGTGQPTREGCPADHQRPGAPDPEPAPGERIQLCYREQIERWTGCVWRDGGSCCSTSPCFCCLHPGAPVTRSEVEKGQRLFFSLAGYFFYSVGFSLFYEQRDVFRRARGRCFLLGYGKRKKKRTRCFSPFCYFVL